MASEPILVFSILSLLVVVQCADEKIYPWNCSLFRCGKLGQLFHPFSNKTQPECGAFVVDGCDQPVQRIQLVKGSGKWYEVLDISQSSTMHIRDRELEQDLKSHNCETLNNLSLPISSYFEVTIDPNITLFKCNRTLNSSNTPVTNINYTSCNDIYLNRPNKPLPAVPSHCSIIQLPAAAKSVNSEIDLFRDVVPEFYLQPHILPECTDCITRGGHCQDDNKGNFQCAGLQPKGGYCQYDSKGKFTCSGARAKGKAKARWSVRTLAAAGSTAGIAFVLVIGCFLWIRYSPNQHVVPWMKRKQNIINVEAILKGVGSLAPKRYSYSEVKKITRSFKNKLGRGGYGWVYQGELHDGRLVAVKILKESKGDGEEFVNEVASISRTAHVNIVALLGFCFEGSARALIYEFMPNGSLESFIYDENPSKTCHQLGWETLYQIALGIARGLEYLHRGCNTKILHFDIKPHNILLDDDFCPKISDFGLAKLCPGKDSIISMLGARGTPGYIAPEVFCRNFGGISHKSDVYSYGMMVLEMVGGRKNLVATADHTSEIYFPHWIYRRLEVGDELRLQGIRDEQEYEKAKKMVIVGLCCIQTDPSNRPPMNRVMEMLHGSLESLQIPPSPFLSSPPRAPLADSSARRQSAIDSVNSAVHNEASFSSSQFHER